MAKHLHIFTEQGKIADTVLLPGDPLRAKYIAETYLEDMECYNTVRGMYGYTGTYKGKRISVQGTGMGMPSTSIYVNELIQFYDVKRLIRIGSCGAIDDDMQLRDVILVQGTSTDSGINKKRFNGDSFAPLASFDLLLEAHNKALEKGIKPKVGNVLTADLFYSNEDYKTWQEYGIMAVEMESAELYTLGAKFKREVLSILTVSDHIIRGEQTTPEERQTSFNEMIEVALGLAKEY